MIARFDGDVILVDYEGLWVHSGQRARATIRRHCEPIACDVKTRLLLFDADASKERLSTIPLRASRPRSRRAA